MNRIEDKIRRSLMRLLASGMGAVIAISAGCLFFMRSTSIGTYEKMENQSVETAVDILTEEIGAQAEQYAAGAGDVIEKQLAQTSLAMEVISGGVTDIYENPSHYPPSPCPNAHEVTGGGGQMHWLLPEGMEYTGEIARETELLGNLSVYFEALSEKNPQILHIFYASESGVNVGYDEDYALKPATFESRDRDWYKDAVSAGEMTVSKAYEDSFRGDLVVTFSMPCYDGGGNLLGVLAADLLIDDLISMVENIDLELGGYAMLVSTDGDIVAAPGLNDENAGSPEDFLGSGYARIIENMAHQESGMEMSAMADGEKYVIYSRIETVDWDILIIYPKNAFVQSAKESFAVLQDTMAEAGTSISGQMLLTGALWAAAVLALIAAVSRASGKAAGRISAPVELLTEDIRKAGEGELSYVSRIHTGDELETLSRAFESMTASLREHIKSLAKMSADKERLATELNVATQIQVSMLPCIFPAFPERNDIDIYASMEPAREVGGDFYDFFLADDDHLYIVMADVSGKGIPAALFMVVTKTLLKDNLSSGAPLAQVFARVNDQLCETNEAGMFVTVFAGRLDLRDGTFEYVNAGHNPPCILRCGTTEEGKAGDCAEAGNSAGSSLRAGFLAGPSGFILAGIPGVTYTSGTIVLKPGEMLFAYTDGVTEAMNADGELYGEEKLLRLLGEEVAVEERVQDIGTEKGKTYSVAEALVKKVSDDLWKYMNGAPQADDITMLALRYQPRDGREEIGKDGENEISRADGEEDAEWQPETGDEEEPERNPEAGDEEETEQTPDPGKGHVLCVRALRENLPQVRGFLDREIERAGAQKIRDAIQVPAEELFVNIANYAYPGNIGMAEIHFTKESNKVKVEFADSGVPYDPLKRPDPDITLPAEERTVGGLGIFLVKQYADETMYRYEAGKNRFTFTVKM